MRIRDMNWMMVEDYLKRDDRAVIPVGSTEQHAHEREQDAAHDLLRLDQDGLGEIGGILPEVECILARQIEPHHVQRQRVQHREPETVDGIDVEGANDHAGPDHQHRDGAEHDGK